MIWKSEQFAGILRGNKKICRSELLLAEPVHPFVGVSPPTDTISIPYGATSGYVVTRLKGKGVTPCLPLLYPSFMLLCSTTLLPQLLRCEGENP